MRKSLSILTTTLVTLLVIPLLAKDRPNIIIFLADDLGYADVGFNGCDDIPTPNIDSIATKGVKFTDGYANHPVCSPSRAGLLTGMYQHRFGFENNSGPEDYAAPNFGVPRDVPMISERLQKVGYKTGMVGKWHVGFNEGLRPHERGYDFTYVFHSGARTFYPKGPKQNNQLFKDGEPFNDETEYLTDAFARDSVKFINDHKASDESDDPFFLFFSFNAVHLPLEATKQYESRFPKIKNKNRKTYAGMLSALDDAMGRVMETVRKHGEEENTLVFFYSDNGGPTKETTSRNDPLRGFKGTLFEGGIRVPYAVQWPGKIPADETYTHPIMSFDITATALAVAGVQLSGDDTIDGKNLLPYLTGSNKEKPHEKLFWRSSAQHAARVGNWKLVKPRGESTMLFDLSNDMGEKTDLAATNPKKLKEVQAVYAAWSHQMEKPRWIRQDRTNAEVGGKLKRGRAGNQGIEDRVARIFENDKNGDGRLSRKEYDGQYFDTMDRNDNGFVTKREATAAMRQYDNNE
jgi:arylsulfatase A-like enzyme